MNILKSLAPLKRFYYTLPQCNMLSTCTETFPKSLSDFYPGRLLAPAALACFSLFCGKCAKRICHKTN